MQTKTSKKLAKKAKADPVLIRKEAVYYRAKFLEHMNALLDAGYEGDFQQMQGSDPLFEEGVRMGVNAHTVIVNSALKGEFGFGPKRMAKFEEAVTNIAEENMNREKAGESSLDIMPELRE